MERSVVLGQRLLQGVRALLQGRSEGWPEPVQGLG